MSGLLPDCMMGPSEPCDAFTRLQDERDRLRRGSIDDKADFRDLEIARLRAMNEELNKTINATAKVRRQLISENERLRRVNAELVEAMQSAPRPSSDTLMSRSATAAWILSYIDWFFKTRGAALHAATEGEPTAP